MLLVSIGVVLALVLELELAGAQVFLFVVAVLDVLLYIKLEFELVFEFGLLHANFKVPVAASRPNTYKSIVTITVIKINGINTIIHDIIDIPP
jgi:hypothetical protein